MRKGITTRIVGPQERFDQRNQMHTQAAIGGVGEKVKERWTKESIDPFRRIFYPEKRAKNVPMRSWRDVADGPINPERMPVDDPETMAARIKEAGKFLGADLVGICELNLASVYSHTGLRIDFAKGTAGEEIKLPHRYAISLAVEMNYKHLRYSPGWIDNAEVGLGYLNVAKPAVALAAYIRELGYPARAHFFINEWVLHVPIAVDAGLGELSRNGIIITAPFGPRVRLSTVTTDLPLAVDSPVDIGAVSTCEICKKCAENCPSQAIPRGGKEIVRGVEKWKVDAERCIRFWVANPNRWNDCARCIAVCPWSRPNVWYHRFSTKAAARSRAAIKILLWVDDIIRGKRPKPVIKWLEYTEGGSPISDKPVE
ncbi:MAG: 4Fe-4S dicluster domain-containing protein [Deltaproteobacteria bacterium]|nr:4Fe-4S dicluster domain-containing protein [Deltaproteobacteria bacterium]